MTDFELISLFNHFLDSTFARLAEFMAGTFAMLISAFFVGSKLSKNMARLVVFLYTLFVVAICVPTLMLSLRFTSTAQLLKERSLDPDSVVADIFLMFPNPYVVLAVMVLILGGAYAGALAFFAQTRKGAGPTMSELAEDALD